MQAADVDEIEELKSILRATIQTNKEILVELKVDLARIKSQYLNLLNCGYCRLCYMCRELGRTEMEDSDTEYDMQEIELD